MATECGLCGEHLQADEADAPYHDEDGDIVCDACYHEHYEDECDRCGELAPKIELTMNPGELIALWSEVDDLAPGYYRVLSWPIYMDGMVTGFILPSSLEYVKPLERDMQHKHPPGGRLCKACRAEVAGLIDNRPA